MAYFLDLCAVVQRMSGTCGAVTQVLQSQADTEAVGGAFASGTAATLITVVGERVMGGLQSGSPAVVCSAARAAGPLTPLPPSPTAHFPLKVYGQG